MASSRPSGDQEQLGIEIVYLEEGAVDVALKGELDLATAPALREYLSWLTSQGWIVITSTLPSCDTSIRLASPCFIRTQRRVELVGGSLVVGHPTRSALRLFDIIGITRRGTARSMI